MSSVPCVYNYTFLDTPEFLSTSTHIASIITFPLHVFGFYCILFKTPDVMKSVQWYLVNLHVWIVLYDYSFGLLTIPYYLLPYLAGIPLGILYFFKVPAAYQVLLMLVLLIYVVNSIMAVFENRFFVICTFHGKEKWRLWRHLWLIAHYVLMLLVVLTFLKIIPDQELARKKVFEGLPCLPDYLNKDDVFVFTEDVTYPVIVFITYVFGTLTECFFFISYLIYYILSQLKQRSMSQKTYKLQRKFFIALVIQMEVPLVMLLCPFMYGWMSVYFYYHNPAFANIAVIIASMHGFVSTLIMILVHHPYRKALMKLFPTNGMRRTFDSNATNFLLYIPCFFAIITSPLLKTPAYKTMLVLAIYDISSIFIHSISTGILGYFGVPFCDYPRLIACLGGVALGSWMGCCIASMTLAVIRICDLSMQVNIKKCFDGNKIYLFLFAFFVYGVGAGMLTKPVIFTPTYMSWFFDPMVGKNPEFYVNLPHTYNNILMAFCTMAFYGFLSYLGFKSSEQTNSSNSSTRKVVILLQSFFFCIFHTIASVLYAFMQFIAAPPYLILVSQIAWQTSSGSVCIVYLTLNKTIRKSVMKMVCTKSYLYGRRVSIMLSMNSNST